MPTLHIEHSIVDFDTTRGAQRFLDFLSDKVVGTPRTRILEPATPDWGTLAV